MRTSGVPSRCIRTIDLRASPSVRSKGSSIDVPQLAMAEAKQLIRTPAASRASQARSNSSSGRSWIIVPFTWRASMCVQPSSRVAEI